jgi:excisionase family DNA binding protein
LVEVSEYLTLREVVELSRMSYTKIRQLVKVGRLRATRPGRRMLVKRADLAAFMEANIVEPRAS